MEYKVGIELRKSIANKIRNVVSKEKFRKLGWFAFYYDEILDYLLQKPKLGLYGRFFSALRPSKLGVKIQQKGVANAVKGRSIKRYYIEKTFHIIENDKVLNYRRILQYPLLVLPEVSNRIQATIINQELIPISAIEVWKPKNNAVDAKYLLTLLNSNLLSYYFSWYIINNSRLTTHLNSTYLERLPFIYTKKQTPLVYLAEYMLFLNKTKERRIRYDKIVIAVNKLINGIVYELYFKELDNYEAKSLLCTAEDFVIPISELTEKAENIDFVATNIEKIVNDKTLKEHLKYIFNIKQVKRIEKRIMDSY